MAPRRVVITGIGLITPLGTSVGEVWESCKQGKTNIHPIPSHWHDFAEYRSKIWSPLPQIPFASHGIGKIKLIQNDPVTLLALYATHEAVVGSGLRVVSGDGRRRPDFIEGLSAERIGVFMGTGIGGVNSCLSNHACHLLGRLIQKLQDRQRTLGGSESEELSKLVNRFEVPRRFSPLIVSMFMPNAASAAIGIHYGIQGPNKTITLACSSGTAAIGEAFRAIRAADIDLALAGGTEYLYDHSGSIFRGFDTAQTLVTSCLDPDQSNCPFDENRSGFLFCEGGAAVLVLEELNRARDRECTILGEIVGYGSTFDAYSTMALEPSGERIARMFQLALEDATLSANEIDYINAHGTGTIANDRIEVAVLERQFGSNVHVNSSKSLFGHTMGASGAIEAAITTLSLHHQIVHESVNLRNPISSLNFVRSTKSVSLDLAISHSFGFGGHNSGLVIRRFQ